MPDTLQNIVIVGANMAGGRAVEALRNEGFEGKITLVGAEPERPYERPPLSKGFLLGQPQEHEIFIQSPEWYGEQGIETRFGRRATKLDTTARRVTLDDGEQLPYDALLIATGANPRLLDVPGNDLVGVRYLRSLADAREIKARFEKAGKVAVVGLGFIGCEIAATARTAGKEAIGLDPGEAPMMHAYGREGGEIVARVQREHGVDLRFGERVTAFEGSGGTLTGIRTAAGNTYECDLAVVGIGVTPNVEWLAGSGVALGHGVLVDEFCRTNVPYVYAAGDVAEWWHPKLNQRLQLQHFDNSADQGTAAAKNMLGADKPYAPVPYFWSDQFDLAYQFAGLANDYDRIVTRGSFEGGAWMNFYLKADRLVATLSVNRDKEFRSARRLISGQVPVTDEQLVDESVELKSLVPKKTA